MPLTRGHVVLTLASSMASTKIMSTGGTIGTLTQDRLTAVMGKLGAGPAMIPMDVHAGDSLGREEFSFRSDRKPATDAAARGNGHLQRNRWQPCLRRRVDAAARRCDRHQGSHAGAPRRPVCADRRSRCRRILRRHFRARRFRTHLLESVRTSAFVAHSNCASPRCRSAASRPSTMPGSKRAKCSPAKPSP